MTPSLTMLTVLFWPVTCTAPARAAVLGPAALTLTIVPYENWPW